MNFNVLGLTRLGIKSESTAAEADPAAQSGTTLLAVLRRSVLRVARSIVAA